MTSWIIEHEQTIRLAAYLGLLISCAGAEAIWARRQRVSGRIHRWINNLGIGTINSMTLQLVFPVLAAGYAADRLAAGGGLFNMLDLPLWLEVLLAIVILDFAIWFQHLASHKIPLLWRLHRMHHLDLDVDVTTAVRFHPIEIILSMAYKLALIWALGPHPAAVILFEVLLNGCALFNHSNLRLPAGFDRIVRWLMVTPDVHRIHHSLRREETDSNYGFSVTLWDRLFRTFTDQPKDDQATLPLGLEDRQDASQTLYLPMVIDFVRRKAL